MESYNQNAARIRARVLLVVGSLWARLGSYRDNDIARFFATALPVVAGGQLATAALTSGYLAALETATTGRRTPIDPIPQRDVSTEALRGVAADVVYRRPAVELYTLLGQGLAFPEAVKRGGQRLNEIAATDLQLAKTHSARRWMTGNDRVVGYRRVLTGPTSCGLCVVASTQRYHRDALLPIHSNCDCGIAPIFGDKDPGQVIDPDRLEAAHAAIAERFGTTDRSARASDFRSQLVVHEHGEIGPVLYRQGHHFAEAPA